jgi:hypothetical protein
MAAYGLDVECPYTFDGTHFIWWRSWMICNFKFISPQMWWIVDVGFSHALDEKNATQVQKKYLHLDCQATNIFYQSLSDKIYGEIMYMKTTHDIWLYLNLIYGRVSDDADDEPKEEAHECVEHDHDLVVVEDCSTLWSSDNRSTTSSLDKVNDDSTSDAIDDDTPCTLVDDGSCSGYESDASTSPSPSPHCFMSQGDAMVSNANVVDHVNSYDELVSRLASMIMSLENEKSKTLKLENKNLFLKNSCEEHKHLLDVLKSSHDELKLTHEKLLVSHEELLEQHASLIKVLSKKIKNNVSSSHESSDQT